MNRTKKKKKKTFALVAPLKLFLAQINVKDIFSEWYRNN